MFRFMQMRVWRAGASKTIWILFLVVLMFAGQMNFIFHTLSTGCVKAVMNLPAGEGISLADDNPFDEYGLLCASDGTDFDAGLVSPADLRIDVKAEIGLFSHCVQPKLFRPDLIWAARAPPLSLSV